MSKAFLPPAPSYVGALEELSDENRRKTALISQYAKYKNVSPAQFDELYDKTEAELVTLLSIVRTEHYRGLGA